ncbi:hypothetical protein [Dactylosporangium sp. CA-233914]|uniref:hypothetical protein n=1 Tax=Dactylosporangium sp. CA-233914 TaxID=3239934 RepID=UPI003D92D2CC
MATGVAAISGVVASPANAGVYGVYPSAEACNHVGQTYTGVLWNYYSCSPATGGSGNLWALWAPGY